MRTVRKISLKRVIWTVLCMVLLCGAVSVNAQAAMKKSKAITLYDKTISQWALSGKKVKVIGSLHGDKSGVSCDKKGKTVSLKWLYYGEPRYIFKNLGGDSTVEAVFYSENDNNIYVFTIANKKVKCLGAICCDCYGTGFGKPEFYYNSSKKTFSFLAYPSARAQVLKTYKISRGKLKCVSTVSRYVGSMNADGSSNIKYYVNNKKKSYSAYKSAWNKYKKKAKMVYWGP